MHMNEGVVWGNHIIGSACNRNYDFCILPSNLDCRGKLYNKTKCVFFIFLIVSKMKFFELFLNLEDVCYSKNRKRKKKD